MRRCFFLFHAGNQLFCQTIFPVDHYICRFVHHVNGACQTAGRTNCIQVSESMPHQKDLIGVFNQLLQRNGNGTNLCFGFLFNSLGSAAKEAKTIFCFNRSLIAASSECHIKRLPGKFFTFCQGGRSKSHTNGKGHMNAVVDTDASCFIQNLELLAHNGMQMAGLHHSIKRIIVYLSNDAVCSVHELLQKLFHLSGNLRLFAFFCILQDIVIAINDQQQHTRKGIQMLILQMQVFCHFFKLQDNGAFMMLLTRLAVHLIASAVLFHQHISFLLQNIQIQTKMLLNRTAE